MWYVQTCLPLYALCQKKRSSKPVIKTGDLPSHVKPNNKTKGPIATSERGEGGTKETVRARRLSRREGGGRDNEIPPPAATTDTSTNKREIAHFVAGIFSSQVGDRKTISDIRRISQVRPGDKHVCMFLDLVCIIFLCCVTHSYFFHSCTLY